MTALIIPQGFRVTPEQFEQLAFSNAEIRLELTANGELIVATGGDGGKKNFELNGQLRDWVKQDGTGLFNQFTLPSEAGAHDAAWIKLALGYFNL